MLKASVHHPLLSQDPHLSKSPVTALPMYCKIDAECCAVTASRRFTHPTQSSTVKLQEALPPLCRSTAMSALPCTAVLP